MPPFIDAVIDWVRVRPPVSWVWPAEVYLPQPTMGGIYREPVETWLPPIPTNGNGGDATEHRDTRRPETTPRRLKDKPAAGAPAPGEFYFKESILDQLDHYFVVLRRMRVSDKQAYALYRQIGAHLLPPRTQNVIGHPQALAPRWLQHRPGFGAIAYALHPIWRKYEEADEKGKKCFIPRFMYFHKFKARGAPPELQRISEGSGDVYVMTVYWDKPGEMKFGAPTSFGMVVKPDGELQLLMTLQHERVKVRLKHRQEHERANPHIYIPQARWALDPFFIDWAREHKTDPTDYLKGIFCECANSYDLAQGPIRVDVAKGEMHAAFSVNVKRTPYFFKDRDVMVNDKGNRRRIFHIVREHDRVIAVERDGRSEEKTITVKSHYRGQRDFLWNGYRIHITVPGLHHVKLGEVDIASYDEAAAIALVGDEAKKWIGTERIGRVMREVIAGRQPNWPPEDGKDPDDDDVRGDAGGGRDAAA